MPFFPQFSITPTMAKRMMEIQEAATLIENLPLPAYIMAELKRESMYETVILSTKIEGNALDEYQKRVAIKKHNNSFEEQEVHNLYKALEYLQNCEERKLPITEELIKKLHSIIQVNSSGRRPRLSEYRTVQNQVSDARTRTIVYLPPEPQDVPLLMEDLVAWVNNLESYELPTPIKAGIFLYQFVTIHPYMDGNGRTARALATYILRLGGLGLHGLFVLEKYYDRNLKGYYDNLQMGLNHNYYFGRNEANLTPWLEFFISGLAEVFKEAAQIVKDKNRELSMIEPELLRKLDVYQRSIFAQLAFRSPSLTMAELCKLTDLAERTIREKVKIWRQAGFVEPTNPNAERIRAVQLTPEYRQLAEEISKDPDSYRYLLK